jgi:hypothetical protein
MPTHAAQHGHDGRPTEVLAAAQGGHEASLVVGMVPG